MNNLPNGVLGKAVAVSVLALLIGAFYVVILSPVLSSYDIRAQVLEQRRETVRRYENAVRDLPRLRASAKQRRDVGQQAELLLAGSSDAVAAAALQSSLKDMIEGEGAKIASASTLPPELAGDFRRVGVRVAFSGNLQLLTTVLLDVEGAQPALAVGNVELHVASDSEGQDEDPDLAISLDIFGYRAK